MAARNIKGITIEIGGDTTKLSQALGKADKDLRQTQASLRDVNKLLKLDPGNVTLLTQKQELLNKQVEETKKRLSTAKEAMEQLKKTNGPDNVTEEQKALEREIIETEQKLKSAEAELKNFGSVGEQQAKLVAQKMSAIGGAVKKAGETMTKTLTVPIVAAGGASVAAWKEVDEAMDTVTTKTGATGKALEDMQGIAKNLATEIPTDFQTAADAVGEVNTRFESVGKDLEDLSGKFVKFAQLNDQDVSTAVDKTQKVMAAFNIPAKEAGNVLDLLTKVVQDTGLSMDTLEGSLEANAVALQEMGFGLSDAAVFLGGLEESGADTSATLTGLKKALQNATKEGKPMSTALEEIQNSIKGAKTDTEAAQISMELFGSKAGPAVAKAVREGKLSFEDLGTSLSDYSGTVETTFEETLDPLDKMKTTLNDLKLIGTDIVETSGPMIEKTMSTLRDIVKELSERWGSLNEGQQETIIKAALVVAALGPVLSVVGSVISVATKIGPIIAGIGAKITAAGGLIPALTALGTAAAPFLIGGAIIIGIITVTTLIIKNWDTIKQKATELMQWVTQKWTEIKENVTTTVENLKTAITTKFENIKTTVKTKIETLKTDVVNKIESMKENALGKIEALKDGAAKKFDSVKEKALGIFDDIKDGIKDKIDSAKETVSDIVEDIKDVFDFDWSLPDLKLPHINVGSYIDVPVLGRIPDPRTMSVDWYRKAYDQPIMFTKPTILQTPYGRKGFGDKHGSGEIVLSDDKLRQIAGSGASYTVNVYGSPGMDVNRLADAVQNRLVALQRQKEAAGIA